MLRVADADAREPGEDRAGAAQTLQRGLDVLEAVAAEPFLNLSTLAERLGLTRSTTHRLASALVERRYLSLTPREGYSLGPKQLELGFIAQQQRGLVQVARPHLEQLSAATGDAVHLGVLDEGRALYLDKLPGGRRIVISSRVGDRQPVTSTGLGKALILDLPEQWAAFYDRDGDGRLPGSASKPVWLERMRGYAAAGRAYDLEENEDRIRCVAAPVRDASGAVAGAISVSSAAQYMDDGRMESLSADVVACAAAISRDLGWTGEKLTPPKAPRAGARKRS